MTDENEYPPGFPSLPGGGEHYGACQTDSGRWKVTYDGQQHGSFVYSTEQGALREARRYAENMAATELIEAAVGPSSCYSREQYENACAAVGLEPASDDELGTYADKYGDFWMSHYTAVHIVTADLRRRRIAGIASERGPDPDSASAPAAPEREPIGICDECGAVAYAGLAMSASFGLACDVDCYDAMADRPGRRASRSGY